MTGLFPDFSPSSEFITSDRIHRLEVYWESCRRDRPTPLRTDIEPGDIADLLPNVVMAEIEDPFRVRYRLVGTKVVDFNRLDFTGRYLDELRWDIGGRYTRAYRLLAEACQPLYGIDAWPLAGAMSGRSEVVMLPLSSDGHRIDRCLSLEDFLFSQHELPIETPN
ncbi:MAG: PAS domain-containing protein [Rhodospirillaceae bacterium]|nr:PAS domain-containing protein [Rhodospirillaceae bacterium]